MMAVSFDRRINLYVKKKCLPQYNKHVRHGGHLPGFALTTTKKKNIFYLLIFFFQQQIIGMHEKKKSKTTLLQGFPSVIVIVIIINIISIIIVVVDKSPPRNLCGPYRRFDGGQINVWSDLFATCWWWWWCSSWVNGAVELKQTRLSYYTRLIV